MSSTAATKPSYAMVARSRTTTPETKRSSSQITPSVREKKGKRNATNSNLKQRSINRGSDDLKDTSNKVTLTFLNQLKQKNLNSFLLKDKAEPSSKGLKDGWHFDKEVFDDEVEEANSTSNDKANDMKDVDMEKDIHKEKDRQADESQAENQIVSFSSAIKQMAYKKKKELLNKTSNMFEALTARDVNPDSDEEEENHDVEEEPVLNEPPTIRETSVKPAHEDTSFDIKEILDRDLDSILKEQEEKDRKLNINKPQTKTNKKHPKNKNNNCDSDVEMQEDNDSEEEYFPINDDDTDPDAEEDSSCASLEIKAKQIKIKEEIQKRRDGKEILRRDNVQKKLHALRGDLYAYDVTDLQSSSQSSDDDDDHDDDSSADTIQVGWGKTGPPPPHEPNLQNTTTKNTKANKSKSQSATSHQLPRNDHDPQSSTSRMEEEDDINSINSDTTTHRLSIEEARRIIPPTNYRYQLQITVLPEDAAKVAEAIVGGNQGEASHTATAQIIHGIKECLTAIKKFDDEAMIISWKEGKNFDHMAPDDPFPQTTKEITKFFDGYRSSNSNKNKRFRATIKMRITMRIATAVMTDRMAEWANEHGYTFKPTIIQAEKASVVGWLTYSSSFTDTAMLKFILRSYLPIEWGFRIQTVTNKDKEKEFRHRLKALYIFAEEKKKDEAIAVASEVFKSRPITRVREYENNFLFLPTEDEVSGQENRDTLKMMEVRQQVHSDTITGMFISFIDVGMLDRRIFSGYPYLNNKEDKSNRLTLRQLIMAIPSQSAKEREAPYLKEGEEPSFQPLFHSIDYTLDSKTVWINGKNGPGGSALVLSCYKENLEEAKLMATGMGVHFSTLYPKEEQKFEKVFHVEHWEKNEGWEWIIDENRYITTRSRFVLENLISDTNLAIRMKADEIIAEQMQEEAEKKKKEEESKKKDEKSTKITSKSKKMVQKKYEAAQNELDRNTQAYNASRAQKRDNEKSISRRILDKKMFEIKRKQYRREGDDNSMQSIDLTKEQPAKPFSSNVLEFNNDDASTTSTITANSTNEINFFTTSDDINKNKPSNGDDSESVQSATSSLKSFNNFTIEQIFQENPNQSAEEKEAMATKMLQHLVTKQLHKGRQLIAQQRMKEAAEKKDEAAEKKDETYNTEFPPLSAAAITPDSKTTKKKSNKEKEKKLKRLRRGGIKAPGRSRSTGLRK